MLVKLLFLLSILIHTQLSYAVDVLPMTLSDGSELQVHVYKANGESLLIVLPSSHGMTDGLKALADDLSHKGVETWVANPFDTWFLPEVKSSLAEIPISAYAALIRQAEKTGKNLYLFSNDDGVGTLLEAAHAWQLLSDRVLAGVILVSPNLYKKTPDAGNRGKFLAIAKVTNLPIFIYMPSKSTLALRIKNTMTELEKGGSDVYVQSLKNIRNRFYFREDASDLEKRIASLFSEKIIRGMGLTKVFSRQRKVMQTSLLPSEKSNKTTGALSKYKGQLRPDDFTLTDIKGVSHSLSQYRGNVLIVNFWASWCPPCVHEMPSMSALKGKFRDDSLEILAINLGEKSEDINEFLKKHPVNFPILLDPEQKIPKQWNVFAFPTSYLLDKDGVIRFSVAGGVDWASKEITEKVNQLLEEQ